MLLYRSLSLGFLGACLLLLATRTPVVVQAAAPACGQAPSSSGCPPIPPGPTIVDVAPSTTAADIARLLHLAASERIAAVDDVPVANTLDAGVALAQTYLSSRRYLDLDVRGPAGERRVLVLVH